VLLNGRKLNSKIEQAEERVNEARLECGEVKKELEQTEESAKDAQLECEEVKKAMAAELVSGALDRAQAQLVREKAEDTLMEEVTRGTTDRAKAEVEREMLEDVIRCLKEANAQQVRSHTETMLGLKEQIENDSYRVATLPSQWFRAPARLYGRID
jgi:hypothetical protein